MIQEEMHYLQLSSFYS